MNGDAIKYNQLRGWISCKSNIYSSIECLSPFDLTFHEGCVYGLRGPIGSGNWGLAKAISNLNLGRVYCEQIIYKNNIIDFYEANSMVCDIDRYIENIITDNYTVKELIQRHISKSNKKISEEDVAESFHLTAERYERRVTEVGNEIFRIAMAIGFIDGKVIFTFPFIGETEAIIVETTKCCYEFLKSNRIIIIIPYDRSTKLNFSLDFEYSFSKSMLISVKHKTSFVMTIRSIHEFIKTHL